MEHIVDIATITLVVIGASYYLFKVFKKSRKGCGSICSGCDSGCQTKVRHFDSKTIPIKNIG